MNKINIKDIDFTYNELMHPGLRYKRIRTEMGFKKRPELAAYAADKGIPQVTTDVIKRFETSAVNKTSQQLQKALADVVEISAECLCFGICRYDDGRISTQLSDLTAPQKNLVKPNIDTLINTVKQYKVE